jgi:hypothetical protein
VLKPNNYRVYRNPDSGKITFFPHGMDQMFWEARGPILPDFNGLAARALVETPEGQRRYRERMTALTTNVFRFEAITNYIGPHVPHIRACLAEMDNNAADSFDGQVSRIYDLIQRRETYLRKQLLPK